MFFTKNEEVDMKKGRIIKILNEIQWPYEIVAFSYKQEVCRLEIINTAENPISNRFNRILRYFLDSNIEIIKFEENIYHKPLTNGLTKTHTLLVINIAC